MYIMKIRIALGGKETLGKMVFESLDDANYYMENAMFRGEHDPDMIVLQHLTSNPLVEAAGTHGGMSFVLEIEKNDVPPKELGE